MNILHLSTSDMEGGAARAAYRLHLGLERLGVTSKMLVRAQYSRNRTVLAEKSMLTKLGPPTSGLPLTFYPHRPPTLFSSQWFPDALASQVKQLNPDIIHLHWVNNGYLKIETLAKFNKPLFWTLHDMWAFTGGCHYSDTCRRYTQACGHCPQLSSQRHFDLSSWIWRRKKRAWERLNLTIVSASTWLASCAQSSSLFQERHVEVIPYGLDLETYKPTEPSVARNLLHLPQDKQLILFGASPGTTGDARKGFHLLQQALCMLSQSHLKPQPQLVVFGDSAPEHPVDIGLRTHYLGSFQDDVSLALVYSAADVMVVPSLQEAFGQTASESLACGTPVVAFNATGLKDIVTHRQNGYLAEPFEVDDLAHGIVWVLEDPIRYQQLCKWARERAEQTFSLQQQASRYLELYHRKIETCKKNSIYHDTQN